MKRRDFLKFGAVAAGTSGTVMAATPEGPRDMDAFLSNLDAGMSRLANEPLLGKYLDGPVQDAPGFAHKEALARKTLRSLMLVGSLHDLSQDEMAHPGVQQRLRDALPEFDVALFGMTEVLESMSAQERADINTVLKDDPELVMKLMGVIDSESAAYGASDAARLKLRGLAMQASTRLKQSPDFVVHEYVQKMNKLAARHGVSAQAQRELAAMLGQQMLWQAEGGAVGGSEPTPPPPPPPVVMDPEPAPVGSSVGPNGTGTSPDGLTPAQRAAEKRRRVGKGIGTGMLTGGGIALGVGALMFGLGFALGSSGGGLGLVLATFGAIFGITAIILLLIGLIVFLSNL